MTAFVTGATGFVGAHVARALLAAGRRVRCLVRPASDAANLAGLSVDLVAGDLTDAASLQRAMADCDEVFHCAADYRLYAREPAAIYRTNVDGTRNVLAAAEALGVRRLVYTSSVATLAARPDRTPLDESAGAPQDDQIGD